ncbi:MAG: methyl-accepting chemotaxis protein [Chitinispirillales bacterium]|jgi:methyl-accepting chemotaxis protein|nr:methyl-accepting chemotaxis protein [Chitinispirillales bacterium]
MIDDIKVGPKLVVGFLVLSLIAAFIGVMGIFSAKTMDESNERMFTKRVASIIAVNRLIIELSDMRTALYSLPLYDREGRAALSAEFDEGVRRAAEQFKELEATLLLPECHDLRKVIEGLYHRFVELKIIAVEEINKYDLEVDPNITRVLADARVAGSEVVSNATFMSGLLNNNAKNEWQEAKAVYRTTFIVKVISVILGFVVGILIGIFLARNISKPLAKTIHMLEELKKGHLTARLRMNRRDEIGAMAATMDAFADELQNVVVATMKQIANGDLSANIVPHDSQDEVFPALRDTIEALRGLIVEDGGKVLHSAAEKDLTHRLQREYRGEFRRMKDDINLLMVNLDEAMHQVGETVDQVSSASGEISSGAQSLAEGANEQASSLQEVSSSLEQMSSMTKQNADNSTHAKTLVMETNSSISDANEAMARMGEAIEQIKTSSDNTAKILKTIDDIAFQTNLLALNAAVEAARAGEAGKGFAVVAEEVRNLAMRSAEAAKNTADLIEDSVKNAESGVKITQDVANALEKAVERSSKVQDLIAEIAAASNEQSQGVEQINTAIAQMNQVTQQNAANSEESASAAEELSSQATELANMVGGFKISGGKSQFNKLPGPKPAGRPTVRMAAIPDKRGDGGAAKATKTIGSNDLIPLDDGDLMEF